MLGTQQGPRGKLTLSAVSAVTGCLDGRPRRQRSFLLAASPRLLPPEHRWLPRMGTCALGEESLGRPALKFPSADVPFYLSVGVRTLGRAALYWVSSSLRCTQEFRRYLCSHEQSLFAHAASWLFSAASCTRRTSVGCESQDRVQSGVCPLLVCLWVQTPIVS